MIVSCCTGRVVTPCFGTGCETPGPPPLCIISYISLSKSAQIRAKPYRYRTKTVHFRTNSVHPSACATTRAPTTRRGRHGPRGGTRTGRLRRRDSWRRWLLAARQVTRLFDSEAIGRGYSPSPAGRAGHNPSVSGRESSRSRSPARSAVTLQRYLTRSPSSVDTCQNQGNSVAGGRFTALLILSVTSHRRPERPATH